jgi:quercetin dioxygenase-like cupin family protein
MSRKSVSTGIVAAFWLAAASSVLAAGNIQAAADTAVVAMAEWEVQQAGAAEQTGARILIAAGPEELTRAPPNAVRYDSQTFRFNNGEIRVLKFHKAAGGVLHQITTETQLYVVKGSATVGVAGEQVEIHAGDVVNLPSGILRSIARKSEDTTVVLHKVRNPKPDAKAQVVRAKDTPVTALTAGPKAGIDTAKVSVQRYVFDGNSIRIARLTGPGRTGDAIPSADALIYLLSGRMEITIGDEVKVVQAGDALCEQAGLPSHWNVLEPSSFVATNGAKAAL